MTSTRSSAHVGSLRLARSALGAMVIVLCGTVMTAWVGRANLLSTTAADFGLMVFNSALCLALLGGGILLLGSTRAWHRRTIGILGAVVVLLAGLTLAEHLLRLDLGIDLPDLHRWLQTRAPAPGRMALGTSFSLLLLGTALWLWPHSAHRRVGRAIQALVITAMVIAVFGLIIREMKLQYLYSAYLFSSMAIQTSFSVIAISSGFWLAWHPEAWNRLLLFVTDDQRIKTSGTVILLVIAISAGFFGFYASQDALEKTLTDSHMQTIRARVRQVETVLEHRLIQAGAVSTRLDVQERLHLVGLNPDDDAVKAQLATIAESGLPLGFSGVVLYDNAGREVARAGRLVEQAVHTLTLGANRRVRLLWSDGFHLRSEIAMFHDSQPAGRVVAEQFLPHLTEALHDVKDFGETGEIELCGRAGDRASCFPTRLNSTPYIYAPAADFQPHPIYRALSGESGHEVGPDYRGTQVFAAYAPIADYGLALVMKVNLSELTAPVRRQLENALPIVALFVVIGIALLNYLVHPLTKRLSRREQQLKLALDNSSLALWDWDTRRKTVYLSEQWQTILGGKPAATSTTFDELQKLVHPDDAAAVGQALRDTLKDGAAYKVEHRVKMHSGEWKWIHSVGDVAERDARGVVLRMSGTNADIGARKQAEERLTHVTEVVNARHFEVHKFGGARGLSMTQG